MGNLERINERVLFFQYFWVTNTKHMLAQASLSGNFTVLKIFLKFIFNCLLVTRHCYNFKKNYRK